MKEKYIVAAVGALIAFIIFSGCSSHMGVVQYDPLTAGLSYCDKQLGENVTVAIMDFPDRRYDYAGKSTLIGTIYGSFKIPFKRIYNRQPINIEVIEAMENLFLENGYQIKKYQGVTDYSRLSDERLAIKGQINKFWTESFNRTGAVVDIDLIIFDTKQKEIVWSGKIEDYHKSMRGMDRGMFANSNKMVLLLNQLLANAVRKAWAENGLHNALLDFKEKNK